MNSIVVDTNVWVAAGKSIVDAETIEEVECIESCADWLQGFLKGDSRILVDVEGKVIDEYQTYIRQGRYPDSTLSQLWSELWGKLEMKVIQFDDSGYAVLPRNIRFHDREDRKFLALALTTDPYAPIYNSMDTDWEKEKDQLTGLGLTVIELCPSYIQDRMSKA